VQAGQVGVVVPVVRAVPVGQGARWIAAPMAPVAMVAVEDEVVMVGRAGVAATAATLRSCMVRSSVVGSAWWSVPTRVGLPVRVAAGEVVGPEGTVVPAAPPAIKVGPVIPVRPVRQVVMAALRTLS
jgi:hypothetical protein